MNKKLILSLSLIALGFAGCGKRGNSALEITISPSESYALPTAIYSCSQIAGDEGAIDGTTTKAVTGRRVLLGKLKVSWKDPDRYFVVDQMVVRFQAGGITGGKYVNDKFDAIEFGAIMRGASGDPAGFDRTTGLVSKATFNGSAVVPTVVQGHCELRVGGVDIKDGNPSFKANGTLKVIGRSVALDPVTKEIIDEVPLSTDVQIAFNYFAP